MLMFTPANPPQDFERLTSAVLHIVENLPGPFPLPEKNDRELLELEHELHTCCSIRQAVFAPQEQVPTEQAVGRICAIDVYKRQEACATLFQLSTHALVNSTPSAVTPVVGSTRPMTKAAT